MTEQIHSIKLEYTYDDDGVWLRCSCNWGHNLGFFPDVRTAYVVANEHLASVATKDENAIDPRVEALGDRRYVGWEYARLNKFWAASRVPALEEDLAAIDAVDPLRRLIDPDNPEAVRLLRDVLAVDGHEGPCTHREDAIRVLTALQKAVS